MLYDIISYDVWGNAKDGYEVNDAHKIDVTELSDKEVNDDAFIVSTMISLGHLTESCTPTDVEIDGEPEFSLYINQSADGCPLYELRAQK